MFEDKHEGEEHTNDPRLIIQSYYETLRDRMIKDGTYDVLKANLVLSVNRWLYQSYENGAIRNATDVKNILPDKTLSMMSHMFNALGMPGVELEAYDKKPFYRLKLRDDTDNKETDKAIREFCSYGFDIYFSGDKNAKAYEESTGKSIEPCDCAGCHAVNTVSDLHPDLMPGIYSPDTASKLTQKILDNLDALDNLESREAEEMDASKAIKPDSNAINPNDVDDMDDLLDQLFNPED